MSKFEDLIAELGERLDMEIFPSQTNVVSLLIENAVKVQIEADKHEEFLTIAAFVLELPPGRFREKVLKGALKANDAIDSLPGTLSYVGSENCLLLFNKLPMEVFTVDNLIECIKQLKNRTLKWKEALNSGHSFPDEDLTRSKPSSAGKMFGV